MAFTDKWLKIAPDPLPLTGADRWNVFLSYRSVNRPWVVNLYDVLRQGGYKVFLDQAVLKAGDPLGKELGDALNASQTGILVWSKATGNSDWVRKEYSGMDFLKDTKPGFNFVPVKLDATKVPILASDLNFLDFSSYPDGPNGGELLRLLHALAGQPLSDDALHFAQEQDRIAKDATNKIGAAIRARSPDRILDLFREGGLAWETSSALGCKAAQGLTELDRNDDAITVLARLQDQFPIAIRPKQLRALVLARRRLGRDLEEAQEIIGSLYEAGERDSETLSIYGQTFMDRYVRSGDVNDLMDSYWYYAEAFKLATDDYRAGINAAAKSVFLGDLPAAENYAAGIVGTKRQAGNYILTATIAEALVIQRRYPEAAQLYNEAVSMARANVGSHRETWAEASRLMDALHASPEERGLVERVFAPLIELDVAPLPIRSSVAALPLLRRVTLRRREYCLVPAGPFQMGTSQEQIERLKSSGPPHPFQLESPRHDLVLDAFYIGRYPVTNIEYKEFLDAHPDRRVPFRDDPTDLWSKPMNWNQDTREYPPGKGEHPVTLVSWHEAKAYCEWLGGRLPTEAEWEKAARGKDGREWPWGEWKPDRCNADPVDGLTTPVNEFGQRGESPYGVRDMAGNVWEWCSSIHDPYPYRPDDGREADVPIGQRVLRGGAFQHSREQVRCAVRGSAAPADFSFNIGFRVVLPKSVGASAS